MEKVTIADIAEIWDRLNSVQQNNLYHQMKAMAFRNQHNSDFSELSLNDDEICEEDGS